MSSHDDDRSVLIIGAGPVGMVMACDLLRQGVHVRIVDAAPGSTVHSRAVSTWPRSLELLQRIGVADHMVDSGARIDAVSYYSGARRLGAIEMSRLDDTPYPYGLCAPQHRTEDVIRTRLVELGGSVETDTELEGLDNSGRRPVATLRGPDGRTETVEPAWLIGADGSHSAVRRLLDVPFEGNGQDVLFAIADAPLDADLPDDEMLYCYARGGAMGLAPFGDGTYRIACAVPVWNDDDAPPRELFQENLDRVVPFPAEVGDLRWTTVFRARRRTAATFRSGRCFLVGDAAHIFSAAGSQGMNTGFQDAVNLGWKLGGVLGGTLDPAVLDTYDGERRHSAERVSLVTAKQTSWGLVTGPGKVAVRDVLVGAAQRTGVMQRLVTPLMSQLSVNYASDREDASVDVRWRRGPVRVGERLPVFVVGEGGGDRDVASAAWPWVAGDRLTVLLWAGTTRDVPWHTRVAELHEHAPPSVDVLDVSAWSALRPLLGGRPAAVVVRPDGHVAATVTNPSSAEVRRLAADAGALLGTVADAGATARTDIAA